MPLYEWKRWVQSMPGLSRDGHWEYELTDSHATPPDESGQWHRVYSVSIGQVPGAGGSPARVVKGRRDGSS